MKKTIIFILLAVYSHVTIAQKTENGNSVLPDSVVFIKLASLEDRISQNEQEIQVLKTENSHLKKEVNRLRSERIKPATEKKFKISRRGSKQVVTE